jgi:3-hydroxyacyl-CoA dehydrogenase
VITTTTRDGIRVVEFGNPPLNALSPEITGGLAAAIDAAEADPSVLGVVLFGSGGAFSSGADIRWFGKPLPPGVPNLRDVIARIEASTKPYGAAIDGVALGGGFEIALACDRRCATVRSKVGLPEIHLGLLPGAGGTQRLPRLTGVGTALEVIVSGAPVPAERALALGMLDAAVRGDVVEAACASVREVPAGRTRASARSADPSPERVATARERAAPVERGGLAAQRCIDAIEAATRLAFDEGLAYERALFLDLLASEQAKSRIHLFFAEREAARIPDVPAGTQPRAIARACVVGAGTMGTGIAIALADGGIPVDLVEQDDAALARGRATIERTYAGAERKGRLQPGDVTARLGRLTFGTSLSVAANADVVIEAVFEELDLKRAVFAQLDRVCRPGAVLATNTSTLDVDAIASAVARPQDVVGLHFFSPANVMRLLEIVRGADTSTDVIATSLALARRIRKVGVVARTCDGFIANRMLFPYVREAGALLVEGALPQDVDGAIREFGFPMGPFAMMDLSGLDVGWRIRRRRREEGRPVGDAEIADALYDLGRHGQKSGAGYYRYEPGERAPLPDPIVEALVVAESNRRGIVRRSIGAHEIVQRCVFAAIGEGARVLEDGTAIRPGDIDVAWVLGFGFPAYRGGPMHYADGVGLEFVVEEMRRLEAQHGDQWQPPPLLEALARDGRRFADMTAQLEDRRGSLV